MAVKFVWAPLTIILIHYVCVAHFHWLWRRKFAALKSKRWCHDSNDDVTFLATRHSNVTKRFWKRVLSEWIRMVITRLTFEWFAGINCVILRSQIPFLPPRWRVAVTVKWCNLCLQFMCDRGRNCRLITIMQNIKKYKEDTLHIQTTLFLCHIIESTKMHCKLGILVVMPWL